MTEHAHPHEQEHDTYWAHRRQLEERGEQRQDLDSLRYRVSALEEALGELRQGLRELTVEVARLSAFMLPEGAATGGEAIQ